MRPLDRSALLAHNAQDLYSLVSDIEAYPRFLPGCDAALVERRDRVDGIEQVRARLRFRVRGVSDSFTTENRGEPGRRIEMVLVEGPFRSLAGIWQFIPLGERACKVSLSLSVDFGSRLMEGTLAPWINGTVTAVMDAFRRRADELYGKR